MDAVKETVNRNYLILQKSDGGVTIKNVRVAIHDLALHQVTQGKCFK